MYTAGNDVASAALLGICCCDGMVMSLSDY